MSAAPLSVLILTYNEECHIERCLRNVEGWADEVLVVDSFSTDRTVELAQKCGVHVVQHEFQYPAQQKNWAMANLPFRHDWLLMLDADEVVPPSLRDEIVGVVSEDGRGFDGFRMRYRLMFYGKWIRHCGWYPVWILRLVRRSKARWEDRRVDEHIVLDGRTGYLQEDLVHESLRDMAFWIAKHNVYSTRNAFEYQKILRRDAVSGVRPRLFGNQAERKRFIKERIWPYLPARGLIFFLYLYVIRRGFLDGRQGFLFCAMHGIFQYFIAVKLWEAKRYKPGAPEGWIAIPEDRWTAK